MPAAATARVRRDVGWLGGMLEHARAISTQAGRGRFGMFGTSVAATWLAAAWAKRSISTSTKTLRAGGARTRAADRGAGEVVAGSTVYLAFIGDIAARIAQRLGHLALDFASPPAPG
jgi:hypothetical protein